MLQHAENNQLSLASTTTTTTTKTSTTTALKTTTSLITSTSTGTSNILYTNVLKFIILACNDGWTTVDGSCMKVFCESKKSWNDANTDCIARNGSLGRSLNEERNDWISSQRPNKYIWFGAFKNINLWEDINKKPHEYGAVIIVLVLC